MNDSIDLLAHLLAAEDHPHLAEEPEHAERLRLLEASPEQRRAFEEARVFNERHPRLIEFDTLPEESRARIDAFLRQNTLPAGKVIPLHPWSVRKQFAWAAALVLLLAGMSVISSTIIQSQGPPIDSLAQTPSEAFHHFVAQSARSGISLQHRGEETNQLVSWLNDQGGDTMTIPPSLLKDTGIGCAKVQSPAGQVSIICFKRDKQILHLFMVDATGFPTPATPTALRLAGREALEWSDGQKAFLLITHKPGETMPEVLL